MEINKNVRAHRILSSASKGEVNTIIPVMLLVWVLAAFSLCGSLGPEKIKSLVESAFKLIGFTFTGPALLGLQKKHK